MGATLVQLVPHSFTDFGDRNKIQKFLKSTSAQLEDKLRVVAYWATEEQIEFGRWYGGIGFDENEFNESAPSIYLRRDFWQLAYPYHYGHIVSQCDGKLYLRDLCCKFARALGSSYSHYCDDFFMERFEELGDTFADIMKVAQTETQKYRAEYFREHDWQEIKELYSDHYDDYFEDILEE